MQNIIRITVVVRYFWKLNIGEINFARKVRGRKVDIIRKVPKILTLRKCVGISSEVFDPYGRTAPVMGGIRLDISVLHKQGLAWDDALPESFRQLWTDNF